MYDTEDVYGNSRVTNTLIIIWLLTIMGSLYLTFTQEKSKSSPRKFHVGQIVSHS